MTKPTEQRYGWWSKQHEQNIPGGANVYETPDGREVKVTNINNSSTDPGAYKWPDAYCVGPITKCVKKRDKTGFQKTYIFLPDGSIFGLHKGF